MATVGDGEGGISIISLDGKSSGESSIQLLSTLDLSCVAIRDGLTGEFHVFGGRGVEVRQWVGSDERLCGEG